MFHCSPPDERPRPRLSDFKPAAKVAGSRLWNAWKGGMTGIVSQPRVSFERHDAAGGLVASVKKAADTYQNEGRRISTKLLHAASDKHGPKDDEDQIDVSPAVKRAAASSGFHPRVCQQIIDEFKKIQAEQEKTRHSIE